MKEINRKIKALFRPVETRVWEDAGLILAAQAILNSAEWRSLPNFEDSFWIQKKEFQVYSQFGDDGIIQWLVDYLGLSRGGRFIEFGVGDYFESNTHFLLLNNRWEGYVIDGDVKNINIVKSSSIYWRYRLNAAQHFITTQNIQNLLGQSGFEKIELLHVDLDGNDYWILDALDLKPLNPDILILEYNALFGSERSITIPYDSGFYRLDAHFSGKYFGASLLALNSLAEEKGYYFIGCNAAGNNAYFLANRHLSKIPKIDPRSGYQFAGFREARNSTGDLTYADNVEELKTLRGFTVINVATGLKENL